MRDYIPKREFHYKLPRAVYNQALWAVRDYDRILSEYNGLIHNTSSSDGHPHGTTPGDPVGNMAMRRADLSEKMVAIDRALCSIPPEYRSGVSDNVMYGTKYPYIAGIDTWSRYRRKFLFMVAKNLRLM